MKALSRKILQPVLFAIALQLIVIAPATAQGIRIIRIKVVDDKEEPVKDANVQIIGVDNEVNQTDLKTNKKGECARIIGQPGTYRVVARKKGFQPAFNENVRPDINEPAEVLLKLKPGDYEMKMPWEFTKKDIKDIKQKNESNKKRSTEIKSLADSGAKLAQDGKYEEAVAQFSEALALDSKQPYILFNRANAYTRMKKYDEAVADYDRAIEVATALEKDIPQLYFQKALALYLNGKIEEGDKIYKMEEDKVKDMKPKDAAQFHYNRGIVFSNEQLKDRAIQAFKQAISLDPTYAEAYYQLGIALSAKEETFTEAIEYLKKYLSIGKKSDHLETAKNMITALGG